jgi:hypothetical protein
LIKPSETKADNIINQSDGFNLPKAEDEEMKCMAGESLEPVTLGMFD